MSPRSPGPTLASVLPAPPSSAPGEAPLPSPPGAPDGRRPRSPRSTRTTWALVAAGAAGCAYIAIADPNKGTSWYPQCPFKAITGLDCPGCGVTRALHALLTGHPGRALDHNALVAVAVVIGLVWFGVSKVRERTGRPPLKVKHTTAWAIAAGVVVVAFWVLRNLSWGPFHWLGSGASGA